MKLRKTLALLTILAGLPIAGRAQVQTTTGINGTVMDSTGAVIPGAEIVVNERQTGALFKKETNSGGYYSFPALLPGLYSITASKAGFGTQGVTDRRVLATQPATLDFTLEVGKTAASVTVSAQGAEILTTSSQTITGMVTPGLVKDIPDIRGNFFDLLTLVPGAVPEEANRSNGGNFISQGSKAYNFVAAGNAYINSGAFVGGNRDSASNVSVDGANVQDPLYQQAPHLQSTDTVQELRVEVANMNAEFGNGASAIEVITKSGTNHFHGDVYEFLRNNAADANLFFNNLAHQPLPPYQQNQYGGSVGGPILKDKLLFFFNFEGMNARQTTNVQATAVPDMYRAGNYSVNANSSPTKPLTPIQLYNPYQFDPITGLRQPFPNNMIPLGPTALCAPRPTCSDPVTAAFLNKWVLHPNSVINNVPVFLGTSKSIIDSTQYTARVDFLKSMNTTLYGRYTQAPVTGHSASYDPLGGLVNSYASYNAVVHWIQTLGSDTVNHFFVAYDRPIFTNGRDTSIPNVSQQIGLKNVSNLPGGPSLPGAPYDMDSTSSQVAFDKSNFYQLQDDLSMVRGRHNVKVGLSLLNKRFGYNIQSFDKGVFNFSGAYTSACPTGKAACEAARTAAGLPKGGDYLADFLLGASSNAGSSAANLITLNAAPYDGYQLYSGYYVQDSWRVTSKLTANVGLRYEHWTPFLVPRHTTLTYDPATGNPAYSLVNPLDYLSSAACFGACAKLNPNVPPAGYKTGNLDFSPRIGIAYALSPSTVLRASFGIYYDGNVNGNQLSNIQTGAGPFGVNFTQTILTGDTPVPTYTVNTMFPFAAATTIPQAFSKPLSSYRFVEPYLPTAAVDQWSFNVEQRLGKIWGLEVSYLGSHTTHEFQFIDVNAAALPQGALASLTLQQRRPYPGWGTLGTWMPIGFGRYNALVASFKNTNPWHNLTLIANFQWTKNIVSSHWGFSDIGNQNFRQPYIWAGDYTANPPTRFVAGYSYILPFGRGKAFGSSLNPILNGFASGWQMSGITTFMSGGWAPIFDNGPDTSGTGENHMPNRICNLNNVPGGRTYLEWFNPSCLAPPTFGTNGNSNLAAFTVPGINNFDMSLSKRTKTGFPKETGEIQFRVDAFNAFNHTQWGSPTQAITSYTNISNGRITTTRPARQMMFSLRYNF